MGIIADKRSLYRIPCSTRLVPLWTVLLLLGFLREVNAVPLTLHYQVRLALNDTGQAPVNGYFKFALIANNGPVVWANDGSTNPMPATAVPLTPRGGVFNVALGDTNVANMAAIPGHVFGAESLAIRVWFSEDNVAFEQLVPDRNLGSVAFAAHAARADVADSIPEGALTENHLPAGFVAQVNRLTAQLAALSNQLASLETFAPAVSIDPNDPALIGMHHQPFLEIPGASWVVGSTTGAPTGRHGHTAVWTGSDYIVWGGEIAPGTYTATGARYVSETDAWNAMPVASAPEARADHVAVWTGGQMLVWGGVNGTGFLRSGGRFDPSASRWRNMSLVNAPSRRTGHVAVWSGKYLVVYGGRTQNGFSDSCAIYDPVSDQWQSVDLPGSPEPRFAARAVWADDRMIVWGGRGDGGALASGGQLVFENGEPSRWLPVTGESAPGARHDHSLVWTGSRMIIWGGERNGTFLNTGASYDPLADRWMPLVDEDPPSGRAGHAGIWTGGELLVQGGETASGMTDTGYAINPELGRWRSIGGSVSAVARRDASVAWTGKQVILFGGYDADQNFGFLRHLDPQPTVYLYRKQ